MLLIFGTKFGQKYAEANFFEFYLHYQKQRYLFTVSNLFIVSKVLEVEIIKLQLDYQRRCYFIIHFPYFH